MICYNTPALKKCAKIFGGIAQLGERLNGIQEVSGSIPLISTKNLGNLRFSRFFLHFLNFSAQFENAMLFMSMEFQNIK